MVLSKPSPEKRLLHSMVVSTEFYSWSRCRDCGMLRCKWDIYIIPRPAKALGSLGKGGGGGGECKRKWAGKQCVPDTTGQLHFQIHS